MYAFDPETKEGKKRLMERLLYRCRPNVAGITREELDELGIEYDGDDLYVPKP
jgi:hypothetical protein